MRKTLFIVAASLLLGAGTAHSQEPTTMTHDYVGHSLFFECDGRTASACFEVDRPDITLIHLSIEDISGIQIGGWVEGFDSDGDVIMGSRFCGSEDLAIPDGSEVTSVKVGAEFFHPEPCGLPFEGSPIVTAGTISITY